jgi:hypothetical protein
MTADQKLNRILDLAKEAGAHIEIAFELDNPCFPQIRYNITLTKSRLGGALQPWVALYCYRCFPSKVMGTRNTFRVSGLRDYVGGSKTPRRFKNFHDSYHALNDLHKTEGTTI